ncbi:efflux RND transporter periplasmic adaptor subunit [Pseudoxanthomonas sp. JBR18]|uniref:HlyD family secretion protein n=1 Tax=Pseudoxanthomonas sp. JBR18 TaxID=2969308 RepID=UPI0023065449|nr:efflux RND transporter periplasmic adaptor subunit [Pseudoxanthomonas sp. JBR18]WCE06079.1 efflux RND transporter periplasmic adaptor subunit [Pseudoxanthomonas sp. JBR18]
MRAWLFGLILALSATPLHATTLAIDGEVYARSSAQLLPPQVDELYEFTITQLAPDGSMVERGQVVVAFDTSELAKTLAEKSSKLQEKRRELDKLTLDQAERARTAHLVTEQARAELDKARRKTAQPKELIAGVDYQKLVNARTLAQASYTLAEQTEAAKATARAAERRVLDAQTRQLNNDVTRLKTSLAAMTLTAPRPGLMLHKSSFSGEKFDIGAKVWKGQSVAEIPDLSTVAVRAELPERDFRRIHPGQTAQIRLEGSGAVFPARVVGIGRTVRSKSGVQPIPILDVELRLDKADARLKPGMSVRVEVNTDAKGSS